VVEGHHLPAIFHGIYHFSRGCELLFIGSINKYMHEG